MRDKILKIIVVLGAILLIYFLKTNFSEYNLKRTISACVEAQKRTTESFDRAKSKKFCEENIRKQIED